MVAVAPTPENEYLSWFALVNTCVHAESFIMDLSLVTAKGLLSLPAETLAKIASYVVHDRPIVNLTTRRLIHNGYLDCSWSCRHLRAAVWCNLAARIYDIPLVEAMNMIADVTNERRLSVSLTHDSPRRGDEGWIVNASVLDMFGWLTSRRDLVNRVYELELDGEHPFVR